MLATSTRTDSVAGKRKKYSAEFKAKVALEAETITELVIQHGVHQTVINIRSLIDHDRLRQADLPAARSSISTTSGARKLKS